MAAAARAVALEPTETLCEPAAMSHTANGGWGHGANNRDEGGTTVHADDGARATDVRRNVSVLMPVVCVVLGSNGGLRREGFTTFRGGAAEPERGRHGRQTTHPHPNRDITRESRDSFLPCYWRRMGSVRAHTCYKAILLPILHSLRPLQLCTYTLSHKCARVGSGSKIESDRKTEEMTQLLRSQTRLLLLVVAVQGRAVTSSSVQGRYLPEMIPS